MSTMRDDFEASITSLEDTGSGKPSDESEKPENTEKAEKVEKTAVSDDLTPKKEEKSAKTPLESDKTDETSEETAPETEAKESADKVPAEESGSGTDGEPDKKRKKQSKAPTGWTPTEREHWKDIPEPVRDRITKREQQIEHSLQDGANNRKTGERFTEVANKYATIMTAEGVTDPIDGVEGLMQTISVLRMGTPQERAKQAAKIIKGYDVDISMLDSALVGEAPASDAVDAKIERHMQPMNDFMRRVEERQQDNQRQHITSVDQELADFGKDHEFFSDVRDDMADLIDAAGRRNYDMNLGEAYNKACAINPSVSEVVQKRGAAEHLATREQTMEAKRNAASSISGKRAGSGEDMSNLSLADQIRRNWDAQRG